MNRTYEHVCIMLCVELLAFQAVNYSFSVANWLIDQCAMLRYGIPMYVVSARGECAIIVSCTQSPTTHNMSAACQPVMWWTMRHSRGSMYRSSSVIPFDSAAWWDHHAIYSAIAGSYDGVLCTISSTGDRGIGRSDEKKCDQWPLCAVTLRLQWVAKVAKSTWFCNDFCNFGCKMTIKYHN